MKRWRATARSTTSNWIMSRTTSKVLPDAAQEERLCDGAAFLAIDHLCDARTRGTESNRQGVPDQTSQSSLFRRRGSAVAPIRGRDSAPGQAAAVRLPDSADGNLPDADG